MNKNEYWLLDAVVEAWYPLVWLVSEDVEGSFNKRHHGLEREELVTVLAELFGRGDLLAHRVEKFVSKEFFTPARDEIEAALDGRLDCLYGLTAQGGARWEEASHPQWERYITAGVYADPKEGEIIGSDPQLVRQYDSLSHYVWDISVVADSKRWDVLQPWEATYWKTLPLGHRVRFRFEWAERSPESKSDAAISEWLAQINNWYTRYIGF
ncbi:MAG TPA: hypothetical protein VGC73_13135 [Pyrinomonadaceae bacterium]|jgi:hypothetical protein